MPDYTQDSVLEKLNQYLHYKKRIPLKIKDGYCHGFALLWLYKITEGHEKWFYDCIKKIVDCKFKDFERYEMDFEKLIAHLEWLEYPNDYIKDIQQLDIDKMTDSNCPLKISSLFDINSLYKTMVSIVKKNQSICLSGPDHTVAVYLTPSNDYYIYDPNYLTGKPKKISRLDILTDEIRKCLFINNEYQMPIHISTLSLKKTLKINNFNLFKSKNAATIYTNEGITNLYLACESGNDKTAKLLLSRGANIHQRDFLGRSLLYIATAFNRIDVLNLLLAHSAKVNTVDKSGCAPLHVAASYGYEECAISLLKAGAKVNIADKVGATPFSYAIEKSHWRTVCILLNYYPTIKLLSKNEMNLLQKHKISILNEFNHFRKSLSQKEIHTLQNVFQVIYKTEFAKTAKDERYTGKLRGIKTF